MNNLFYKNIVKDIQRKIETNKLQEYSKLPSEREMSLKYNVSRNVIREVLTELRVKGLLVI